MTDIPLAEPMLGEKEAAAVRSVLESGWLTHGDENDWFETRLESFVGVDHAISVNSGTSALYLSLLAHGITGEVLVPSFTFVATANAIAEAGATPVFVDIHPETRNMDPSEASKLVTTETEAIVPVHFAGLPCSMGPLMELADRNDLVVIEDCAQALGATYQRQQVGSFGTGCFSFFPTKAITTGEGGAITTHDDDLADQLRTLRAHGIPERDHRQDHPWERRAIRPGYNFRLSNILAAIGRVQMTKLEAINRQRRYLADEFRQRLDGVVGIEPPERVKGRKHVYQMFTALVAEDVDRDALVHGLNERGIEASVHFDPPVHLQPPYRGGPDLLTTELVAERIITLPMYPGLSIGQIDRIAEAVEEELHG